MLTAEEAPVWGEQGRAWAEARAAIFRHSVIPPALATSG